MRLYNKALDKVEELKVIGHSTGTFYPDKINETDLNILGYYIPLENAPIDLDTQTVESKSIQLVDGNYSYDYVFSPN